MFPGLFSSICGVLIVQEIDALNRAVDAHEGCILEGWLDLKRVAGNFRVSIHMDDYFMMKKVCSLFPPLSFPFPL